MIGLAYHDLIAAVCRATEPMAGGPGLTPARTLDFQGVPCPSPAKGESCRSNVPLVRMLLSTPSKHIDAHVIIASCSRLIFAPSAPRTASPDASSQPRRPFARPVLSAAQRPAQRSATKKIEPSHQKSRPRLARAHVRRASHFPSAPCALFAVRSFRSCPIDLKPTPLFSWRPHF